VEMVSAFGPAPDRDPWAVAAEEAAAESATRLVTVS